MCTIILAWQAFDEAPVVVAANRDEATDRPASGPAVRDDGPRRYLAPRDERAGGTWIGVSEEGVLAAVTNRWTTETLPADRSRGLLLRDALGAQSASEAADIVDAAVSETAYDGFNVLVADAESAWLLEWSGRLRRTRLDAGVHVVVNVGADGRYKIPNSRRSLAESQAAGATRARATLAVRPEEPVAAWRDRARELLADHDAGFCVHGDGYGTRSSSVITVRVDGSTEYAFADGRPCEVEHATVDGQL